MITDKNLMTIKDGDWVRVYDPYRNQISKIIKITSFEIILQNRYYIYLPVITSENNITSSTINCPFIEIITNKNEIVLAILENA